MTPKRPETPEEQWDALVRFGAGAEARALAEHTDAEVDAALVAHGYDLDKVQRDGEAFVAQLFAGTDAAGSDDSRPSAARAPDAAPRVAEARDAAGVLSIADAPRRSRRPAWAVMLVAAAIVLLLAVGGGVVVAVIQRPQRAPFGPGPDLDRAPRRAPERSPEQLVADDLRRDANSACARQDWAACAAKLEEAKRMDPAGDSAADVQADWARAAAGMKLDDGKRKKEEGMPDKVAPRGTGSGK